MNTIAGKIVLVNMSDCSSEVTFDLLRHWGYQVHQVGLSQDQMLIPNDSDLLLFQFLDYSSCELELCQRICWNHPTIQVVATAPFISIKNVFALAKLGIFEFIPQPFSPEELKRMLEKFTAHTTLLKKPENNTVDC
ncbi:MAG: hypothetical protein NTW14_07520 [bacterium]|nr:hypothetical protein [bacterium]